MEIKINISAPFEFCESCNRCEIDQEEVIFNYTEKHMLRYCKNKDICINAVKLYLDNYKEEKEIVEVVEK